VSAPCTEQPPEATMSRRRFLLGGATLATGLLVADAAWLEPQAVRVDRLCLRLDRMPAGRSLRLVQLSDLHLRECNDYFQGIAAQVNRLQPDLILLTGDYVDRNRNLDGVLEFLGQLRAAHGIVAVQGNWEYWARIEGDRLRRRFDRVGVRLLINQRHDVTLSGAPVSILGVDYPASGDQVAHMRRIANRKRINILLSHVPAFAHDLLGDGIALILCGHTHGGQVRLPLLPPLYLPRFSGPFVSGLYHTETAGLPLYVSRGLGTSTLPIRFMCPPEITLVELRGPEPT
jgi:uncharacterized protein